MDHVSANKTLPVTERENISGARVFDGEDQGAGNRYRMQQLQQQDWCEQQIREKQQKKQLEKETTELFDKQALEFHDNLKYTQSEHNRQRTENEQETLRINGILAQQKKDREVAQHDQWANLEKHELNYTLNHDFMTENPATEVSMLADHRKKPYHFKGFRPHETEKVNLERQQQINEQQFMKQQKIEEDKLYAMQQEAIRRQQVLADRQLKRGLRGVAEQHFGEQTLQAAEAKQKWIDPYHERVNLDPRNQNNYTEADGDKIHKGQDKL